MKGIYTILLLIVSNVFMTFAWYGHLKMKQEYTWFASLPLIGVIAFSWAIAFFEYSCQIPANRIGFIGNGGPFTLMQLKVIQEVITLVIFTVFTTVFFKGDLRVSVAGSKAVSYCTKGTPYASQCAFKYAVSL